MADYLLKVSPNALIDRLRVLQSDLTGENRHSDAMTVDFAIQVLSANARAQEAARQPQILGQMQLQAGPKDWQAM